jgi:hypothetical protein
MRCESWRVFWRNTTLRIRKGAIRVAKALTLMVRQIGVYRLTPVRKIHTRLPRFARGTPESDENQFEARLEGPIVRDVPAARTASVTPARGLRKVRVYVMGNRVIDREQARLQLGQL